MPPKGKHKTKDTAQTPPITVDQTSFAENPALMAETEVLEWDAFHTLQTEQTVQQQRAAMAQPANVRRLPIPAPGEGPAVQAQQRAGWKDRHVRKTGAQHLHRIARAQQTGEVLSRRTQAEQEANPLEIDQTARATVQEHVRQIKLREEAEARQAAYKAWKEEKDRRWAADQMNRGSENLRKNMMKTKDGPDTIERIKNKYKVQTNDMKLLIGGMFNLADREFFNDIIYNKYQKIQGEVNEVNELATEYGFRRECVLPAFTGRGVKRPDLAADLARMEAEYLDAKQKIDAKVQQFVEETRASINEWYKANRDKVATLPPQWRGVIDMNVINMEPEEKEDESEEVVDLEELESELSDSSSDDDGIEEI